MFMIGVRSSYEAAHSLEKYEGPCGRVHGHSYEVEAVLAFPEIADTGMAYDFVDADAHLRAITDSLDHTNLNDLAAFQNVETTAENQARFIFDELKGRMGAHGRHLRSVRVWEGPRHWAEYSEG